MSLFLNKSISFFSKTLRPSAMICKFHSFGKLSGTCMDMINMVDKNQYNLIPTYGVLSDDLMINETTRKETQIDDDILLRMYKAMVSLNIMDTILYECQRQGRISFYMTNFGEEAVQIGSAAALSVDDLIYAQYRESGVLLWRGFEYKDFINQCFGNIKDANKGRQMPVHYGSKPFNFITISSPLATQLPQAVGAAYGLKNQHKNVCVTCYFGEGAASEGDTHAALNFAATLECPVLFICRNNGYAISTPTNQQYKGDGIAAKGPAYGISTIRVDGNDALAMFAVTKSARDYVIKENKPVLVEAMTYRIGDHSTSDDSTAYRSRAEISKYSDQTPISRLKNYLRSNDLWNDSKEEELYSDCKNQVMSALALAEEDIKPNLQELFTDVYNKMPNHLTKQFDVIQNHVKKYAKSYAESRII